MKNSSFDPGRRTFLVKILAGSAFGAFGAGLPSFVRQAAAAGTKSHPQSMQKIQGDVKINGIPAKPGATVKPGDTVTTGQKSMAVFVVGQSAYLLRENSHLKLASDSPEKSENKAANILRLVKGKMLSVFGRGKRKIMTPTAVAGVRGTGIYLEVEPDRTFICLCYGTADIDSKVGQRKTVKTKHHGSPMYIYADKTEPITGGTLTNHTDEELIMLESLVGRKPPFVKSPAKSQDGY
ncbi:MAG: hypothetical protein GY749_10790 [Desulfobacteraceae bacterium]|nr:hypothetical protein [Desulfobacteraceae bacterium]